MLALPFAPGPSSRTAGSANAIAYLRSSPPTPSFPTSAVIHFVRHSLYPV